MTIGSELVEFPVRRPGEDFPPPQWTDYRGRDGMVFSVMPTGSKVWLATRYEDVRAVLTDRRISSDPRNEGFPTVGRTGGVPGQDEVPGWFVALDPPEHDRFRKALTPEFTVRRIREARPAIQQVVDGVLDDLVARGGEADLVRDFAGPVPSLVIAALLGVPEVDRPFFEQHIRTLVTLSSTDDAREESGKVLLRYLNRLIRIKQRRPGTDLLGVLIKAGTLSVIEMSGAAMLLLIAGQETTANNMALGALTLLTEREWIGDERVVEEVLRYYSVGNIVALRVATEDLEIGGQQIAAGDGIVPMLAAANHDDGKFGCPHRFDPARSARHHVAFGFGVHQCLGQHLVRAEMDIAYRSLFERLPDLHLAAGVDELPFRYDGVIFGLEGLPVRWTP